MRAAKLPWAGILDPDWIRKLAENGDVRCMFYLNNLYLYGREGFLHEHGGFQQDQSQAIRWLREAARLGNEDAKDKLFEIGEMDVTSSDLIDQPINKKSPLSIE
jgi:TPR repeat protein